MKVQASRTMAVLVVLGSIALGGCAMDQNNVGDVYGTPDSSASHSDTQYPESMKTGSASGDSRGPTLP